MVSDYIKKLHLGSAPGCDGITAEHLKHALGSGITQHPSVMYSLCLGYGVGPTSFKKGVLIHVLKKPTLDSSVPGNYRPITISSTLSKIIELYILQVSSDHELISDLHFGFIAGRETSSSVSPRRPSCHPVVLRVTPSSVSPRPLCHPVLRVTLSSSVSPRPLCHPVLRVTPSSSVSPCPLCHPVLRVTPSSYVSPCLPLCRPAGRLQAVSSVLLLRRQHPECDRL